MMPGVTNLPAPSITTGAPPPSACLMAGSSALLPTAAILLSRMSSAPFTMRGPTAVKMVTFSMSVGLDGNGSYVLGNGSALGTERAPGPAVDGGVVSLALLEAAAVVAARAGAGACEAGADFAHPATVIASARASRRIASRDLRLDGGWCGVGGGSYGATHKVARVSGAATTAARSSPARRASRARATAAPET